MFFVGVVNEVFFFSWLFFCVCYRAWMSISPFWKLHHGSVVRLRIQAHACVVDLCCGQHGLTWNICPMKHECRTELALYTTGIANAKCQMPMPMPMPMPKPKPKSMAIPIPNQIPNHRLPLTNHLPWLPLALRCCPSLSAFVQMKTHEGPCQLARCNQLDNFKYVQSVTICPLGCYCIHLPSRSICQELRLAL